jgi:hypothetical protein
MNTTERRGFLIIVVVFLYTVTVIIYFQVSWLVAAANAQRIHWTDLARHLIFQTGMFVFLLLLWGRAIRMGHEVARWAGFAWLVIVGVSMIWLAVWWTTLDHPNAAPEERVKMQAEDLRRLLWGIGEGVLHIIVGASLLLPPVGAFLGYRRRSRVEPAAAPEPACRPTSGSS